MSARIVRLIAGREFRDLLRDRRSVFMLIVLPILLYPGFGLLGIVIAYSLVEKISNVGVVGMDNLPAASVAADADPPLVIGGKFDPQFLDTLPDVGGPLQIVKLDSPEEAPLAAKKVDVMMIVPPDARDKLAAGASFTVELKNRDADDFSKLATRRLIKVLAKYGDALKESRFVRRGLTKDFDQCLVVHSPKDDESAIQRSSDEFRDRLAKFFPFMLVMWALTGALHPAVDVCAGEKERGTMETLLISPAERTDIVAGKFLAVWIYATITAWWNLVWMGGLCLLGSVVFPVEFIKPSSIFFCYLLTLPMTALFAALGIAMGIYARSTKEGQYYLLPLFLGALPLVFLSLLPGFELTWKTSFIPVTGLCLLMQKLIGPAPWVESIPYWLPVLAGLGTCVLLSGWWAVRRFHREDVLFRESEASPLSGLLVGFRATKG